MLGSELKQRASLEERESGMGNTADVKSGQLKTMYPHSIQPNSKAAGFTDYVV